MAAAVLCGFLFGSKTAWAADFPPSGIKFRLDLQVEGEYNDYLKIVSGQRAKFSGILTLVSLSDSAGNPQQELKIGIDNLILGTGYASSRAITELGMGIEPVSGNSCRPNSVITSIMGNNAHVLECDFIGGLARLPSQVMKVNQPYRVEFDLPSPSLGLLGLNQPCAWNSKPGAKTPCIGVYPYFNLSGSGISGGKRLVMDKVGKTMFIDQFANPTALAAAPPRPADLDSYGAREGSPTFQPTGNLFLDLITRLIGSLVGLFQEFIFWVFYLLLAPMIQAMLSIRTYTDTFVAVVYPGWIIVRNASNILFIVAIIAIGLGTLFRLEKYQFKHLLVQLILAALLVNFSLVIAQVILGIADTIQNQFLPNNVEVIRALARGMMLGPRDMILNSPLGTNGTFASTIKPLFYLAVSIGSFAVFAAMAMFLLVRIVMLWVLLLISPIAYVAGVLPTTAHYRGEWWSNFIKYAFFTPIIAFFLNIAALFVTNQSLNPVLADPNLAQSLGNSDLANFVFSVSANIMLVVFLFVALQVAQRMGVIGGSVAADWGKRSLLSPFAAAGWGAKTSWSALMSKKRNATADWADQGKFKKLMFAVLNPTSVKEAAEDRWKRRQEQSKHYTEGKAKNLVYSAFKEPMTDQASEAMKHMVGEMKKDLPSGSEEVILGTLMMLAGKKDLKNPTEKARLMSALQVAVENKATNSVLQRAKELHLSDKNYSTDDAGLLEFLNDFAERYQINRSDLAELYTDWSASWYKNNEYSYGEMLVLNEHGHPQLLETYSSKGEQEFSYLDGSGKEVSATIKTAKGGVMGKEFFEKMSLANDNGFYYNEQGASVDLQAEVAKKIATENSARATAGKAPMTDVEERSEYLKAQKAAVAAQMKFFRANRPQDARGFANAQRFMQARAERASNLAKLGPREKARDYHWNAPFVYDKDGNMSEFTSEGLTEMARLNKADLAQSENLNPKKALAWKTIFSTMGKPEVVKNIRAKLEEHLVAQMKERGYRPKEIQAHLADSNTMDTLDDLADIRYQMTDLYINGGKMPGPGPKALSGPKGKVTGISADSLTGLDLPIPP